MTSLRSLVFILALAPLSFTACGDDGNGAEAGLPEVDCAAAPVPKYSEMTAIWNKCTVCHSSALTDPAARMAAPAGYNYDTYEAAKAEAEEAMEQVYSGEMPRPPAPDLTADEKGQLRHPQLSPARAPACPERQTGSRAREHQPVLTVRPARWSP